MSEIPSWFVILMGMGTVFVGLVCIVLLCKILSAVCSIGESAGKNTVQQSPVPVAAPAPAVQSQNAANRQEIIAAIGTVIAEECGVDVNAIRIVSIKKV